MSTQKNLITLCFATVFTLGLAACGGGGGDDAPVTGMMDGDGSLEGKYIPSGTTITGVDAPTGTTLTADSGDEVTVPGVGTVECASEGGCSGTVEDGVVTITGDLKIVSVDPDLDSATATVLAGLAVDMLPEPELTPADQLMAAQARVGMAQTAVDTLPADATPEQVGAAYAELTAAQQMLAAAQNLPENLAASQMAEVAGLIEAAQMLVTALTQTSSQEDVDAANMAIASAQTALTGATALSTEASTSLGSQISGLGMDVTSNDDARTAYMVMQTRSSVNMAVTAAQTAVDGLSSSSTAQNIMDAQALVDAAEAEVDGAANLPAHEVSALRLVVGSLDARIMSATASGTELAAAQRVSSLYQAVQGARNAADTAADNADAADKSAAANVVKRTTRAVSGESETARENSQAVLDAGTDASAAVTAAKAAKAALEALDTEDIDAGHKAVLDQAIEEAMEYADAQIEAAEASETATEPHVAMVEGPDMDEPRTAADDATDVADAVKTALETINVGAAAPMDAIKHDGSKIGAKTWAAIVGAGKLSPKPLGTNRATVMVASIAGMLGTDVHADLTDEGGEDSGNMYADGDQTTGALYNAIPGTVYCLGADCSVDANGKLAGSWYFTPGSPDELYVANPAEAGSYMVATQYARYGYWLSYTADADDDPNGVATYADEGHSTTNTDNLNLAGDAEGNPVTARYTGPAVGISVMNDSKGAAAASGHFDATVSLTARFGATPTLGGNVTNFVGNAVNSGWNVVLNQTNLDTTDADLDNGIAYGGAAAGTWTAQGYGPVQTAAEGDDPAVDHRPEGFFGRFNANMLDGAVAGAYTTRADD